MISKETRAAIKKDMAGLDSEGRDSLLLEIQAEFIRQSNIEAGIKGVIYKDVDEDELYFVEKSQRYVGQFEICVVDDIQNGFDLWMYSKGITPVFDNWQEAQNCLDSYALLKGFERIN